MRLLVTFLCATALLAPGCTVTDADPTAMQSSARSADGGEPDAGTIGVENSRPGDSSWRQAKPRANPQALSAYADKSSATPGVQVGLHVSTTGRSFSVRAYRMGHYGGAQARSVWESGPQPGRVQSKQTYNPTTRSHVADWQESMRVDTSDWPPGVYMLRLKADNGAQWFVPLVLRDPEVSGRLVLVIPDTTSQVYNTWGGRSAYTGPGGFSDRSRVVSFSRPYVEGAGAGRYFSLAHPVVVLAERSGLPVSYVSASDLDTEPDAMRGAEGVVVLGHDEYWTPRRRKATERARDAGTDLAFLGANTMYWRTRVHSAPDGSRTITIYKNAAEDPVRGRRSTVRFRDPPRANPERSLIGMDYECYPAKGTFVVTQPRFFLYRGTGASRGQRYSGIVDIEVDRAYPLPGTPDNLQIVANNPTDCGGAQSTSTSTYYSTPSGAGVFATGTVGWISRGMRSFAPGDPRRAPDASRALVRKVTLNLLRAMSKGQMGAAHPAKGNIEQFSLPRVNTTGKA